jgi:hypothetical protein
MCLVVHPKLHYRVNGEAGDAPCCDAPSASTCNAFLQTFHIRLAPTPDRWAQEFFCARDSAGRGRLTPVSTAFASCLSLTSPDVRECTSDAECQLPAPLGHGPGFFCAEMPCCATVNSLLNELPDGTVVNTTIRTQASGSGPRKICRPDAVAFGNAGVCSARTTPSTIDSSSGMSISFSDPVTHAPLFNASLLSAQAGLDALPRVYANIDIAAQDYAAAMDPTGYAKLRNTLADQAQAAVSSVTDIPSILKLRSQLDSSIVDFAYSLAGQPPKQPAAGPDTAPAGALAPTEGVISAVSQVGAPSPKGLKKSPSSRKSRGKARSSFTAPASAPALHGAPSPIVANTAKAPSPNAAGPKRPVQQPLSTVASAPAAGAVGAPAHAPESLGMVSPSNFTLGLREDGSFAMMKVGPPTAKATAPVPAKAPQDSWLTDLPLKPDVISHTESGEAQPDNQDNPVGLYGRAFFPPAPTEGTIPGIVHELLPGTVGWLNTTNGVTTGLLQPAEHFVNGTAANQAFQATVNTVIDNTVGNGPYRTGVVDGAALFGSSSPEPQTVDKRTGQGPWVAPPDTFDPPPTPVVGTVSKEYLAAEHAPPAPANSAILGILQALEPQSTLGRLPPTRDVVNSTAASILG